MSYVDEVFDLVVAKNPAQPEFHQAVKEVLESLRVVIEANEEKYRKDALLERNLIRFQKQRESQMGQLYIFFSMFREKTEQTGGKQTQMV